jgi:hypothetical protein
MNHQIHCLSVVDIDRNMTTSLIAGCLVCHFPLVDELIDHTNEILPNINVNESSATLVN